MKHQPENLSELVASIDGQIAKTNYGKRHAKKLGRKLTPAQREKLIEQTRATRLGGPGIDRCVQTAKSTGNRCRNPKVRGYERCLVHIRKGRPRNRPRKARSVLRTEITKARRAGLFPPELLAMPLVRFLVALTGAGRDGDTEAARALGGYPEDQKLPYTEIDYGILLLRIVRAWAALTEASEAGAVDVGSADMADTTGAKQEWHAAISQALDMGLGHLNSGY